MPKIRTDDVYSRLGESTGLQKREVERVIEHLKELITTEMKKGNEVVFTGFGSFLAKERRTRKGVNPKTKERMQIPSVLIAKFKTGKNLKEALKENTLQPQTPNPLPS